MNARKIEIRKESDTQKFLILIFNQGGLEGLLVAKTQIEAERIKRNMESQEN